MKRKPMWVITVAFIAGALSTLSSCGEGNDMSYGDSSGNGGGSPSGAISVGNNFFNPRATTANAGNTVNWQWDGNTSHSVTSGTPGNPEGTFDSGIKSSGSFSHTFVSEGTFPYYCRVHGASAAMTGTIIVTTATGGGDPYP